MVSPTQPGAPAVANRDEPSHSGVAGSAKALQRPAVVLIGFMGTGKSTVGALLAERLNFRFCDVDRLIESAAARTIPEIFEAEGEAGFRRREREAIESLRGSGSLVVATGGGAVLNETNRAELKALGVVVELRAAPKTVCDRVGDVRGRPLLADSTDTSARIRELMQQRAQIYEAASHFAVETDGMTPEQVVHTIMDRYESQLTASHAVTVPLADRTYTIHIEEGLITQGNGAQRLTQAIDTNRICIVTHPGLATPYAAPLQKALEECGADVVTIAIPPGERYKTLRAVEKLYSAFLDARLDRKSLVIALGGGVLGDVVGFASASYLRGIRFVQAPTTLLAQVDSSVGGKTGVDLPAGKNLVGAFHQPSLVLVDPRTLNSLPPRELRSGVAEVIKYGIIYDEAFFAWIVQNLPLLIARDAGSLTFAIRRSCEIKADVVGQDETEQGLRAILNFGHTIGHALEAVTQYRRYKHGEAIAIGMVSAALIGEEVGATPAAVTGRIAAACRTAGLPVLFPEEIETEAILEAAQRDKKTESGRLRFVLARAIGEVYVERNVPESAIKSALSRQRSGEF